MVVEVKTMDVKKAPAAAAPKDRVKTKAKAATFVSDIKGELKRITWTPRDELWIYTKIVVATTVVMGLGIYIVDLCIQGVLSSLSAFAQFLGL